MTRVPIMRKSPVPFRSGSDSAAYNQLQEDIFYDVSQLFQYANELEDGLNNANIAMNLTTRFQNLRMQELEQEVHRLTSELDIWKNSQVGSHKTVIFTDGMENDPTASVTERAHQDISYNIVTLPVAGKITSKVYMIDEVANRIALPSSVKVDVQPVSKPAWIIEDRNPLYALNGDNTQYWHRTITMALEEAPKDVPTTEFIVTLPDTIISNRDVNTIYIHPFPLNGVTIRKIEYRMEGDWSVIPGWDIDEHTQEPKFFEHAGRMKFCFPDIAISQIKVTLSQPDWFEENHKKVYHFGIQELGVFHTDYQSTTGKINIPVVLQGNTPNKLLTGLIPKFANTSSLSDTSDEKSTVFSYHIYMVDDLGQLRYTKDVFPILVNTNRILIKATLYADPYTGVTPALESVELSYEDV